MTLLLYRVLYLPGLLIALPYYLYRMWRRGGYAKRFGNRFGLIGQVPQKRKGIQRIWIQAVSVGELLAIGPLLKLFEEDSSIEVVLTTTTSTGYRVLEEKYAGNTVWHGIFPMDFWCFSKRAWNRLKPDIAILMEGELWPEHIHQASQRQVPVILVNARLSDRSFKRHFRMKKLLRPLFGKLSGIYAGSETDLKRFRSLKWLPVSKVQLSGNLKLDLQLDPVLTSGERAERLRELGFLDEIPDGKSPIVLLGSSTWPGEEAALLEAFLALEKDYPFLRLLIVPRHAERRREIENLVQDKPVKYHFRSDSRKAPEGTRVYIADTTGELRMLTQLAQLVLIGKSLPPNSGGQTPVEAAALGKPLIFGPDMSNFRDISRRLVRAGAVRKIRNEAELVDTIRDLLSSPENMDRMGKVAEAYIQANHGATGKTFQAIKDSLPLD